jgi:hypothetical protein
MSRSTQFNSQSTQITEGTIQSTPPNSRQTVRTITGDTLTINTVTRITRTQQTYFSTDTQTTDLRRYSFTIDTRRTNWYTTESQYSTCITKTSTIYTTTIFTATCPVAPTTITSYCQTFTIPTPCVTVITCPSVLTTCNYLVVTTSCPVAPTCITTGGETFTVTTTGWCTLSCSACHVPAEATVTRTLSAVAPVPPVITPTTPRKITIQTHEATTMPSPSFQVFLGAGNRFAVTTSVAAMTIAFWMAFIL